MAVEAQPFYEKTDEQKAIIEMVRQFVDEQILPQAEHIDHEDEFPEEIVEQMKELGLFGVTIPEEYGGMGLDLTTYSMIVEELSRGWISISGVVNTHFIGSYLLMKFGTDAQREHFLPRMATGEIRAAFSLSEPPSPSWAPTSRRSRPRRSRATAATGRSPARRCGSRTACAPASCSCWSRPTATPIRRTAA
jgi:alkylation response protein AidB-like acyl-CoA dehydrogenase